MTTPSGAVRQILYGRDPHLVPTDGDTYLLKVCASREAARSVGAASARSVSGGRPPLDTALPAVGSAQKTRGTLFPAPRCKATCKLLLSVHAPNGEKFCGLNRRELRSEVQAAVSVVPVTTTSPTSDLNRVP